MKSEHNSDSSGAKKRQQEPESASTDKELTGILKGIREELTALRSKIKKQLIE